MNIAFVIGWMIGIIIFFGIKACSDIYYDYYTVQKRRLKKLSPDKKPEAYRGGYIIYANNTRWFYSCHVHYELYWIPYSMGDDMERLLSNDWNLEYKATWLSRNEMYNSIRKIIYTHPNLEAPNLYWKIVKLFK